MIYTYIILFFIYAFLGWVMEVFFTFFSNKKLVNRGFLLGPLCPIYGWGCLLLHFLLKNYTENVLVLFVLTFFTCSTLEYLTSYVMEKIFKLRWWDYTKNKYNLNGRICLETMTPFSILGVLSIKYATPFFLKCINLLSSKSILIIVIILISLFLVDNIISFNIIFKLKSVTKNLKKDSTVDIKNAIKKFIVNDKYFYNRIVESFPNLTKNIKQRRKIIKDKKK